MPVLVIYGSGDPIRIEGGWGLDGAEFVLPADFLMMSFDRLEVETSIPLHVPTRILNPGDTLKIPASDFMPVYSRF